MFYNEDDVNILRDTPSTISDATNTKHDEVDKDLSNEKDGKADSDEDFVPENTDHQPQKSEVGGDIYRFCPSRSAVQHGTVSEAWRCG